MGPRSFSCSRGLPLISFLQKSWLQIIIEKKNKIEISLDVISVHENMKIR